MDNEDVVTRKASKYYSPAPMKLYRPMLSPLIPDSRRKLYFESLAMRR